MSQTQPKPAYSSRNWNLPDEDFFNELRRKEFSRLDDHGHVYPCAISVGMNPTFDDIHHRSVEAYLLDQNQDLYDHDVEIEFVSRLRGMVAYEGVEPLIEQMKADVEKTREVLGLEKK
jgi:riboflavin kinase/FMN adenylyltransferase